jgi:hypothetical protein
MKPGCANVDRPESGTWLPLAARAASIGMGTSLPCRAAVFRRTEATSPTRRSADRSRRRARRVEIALVTNYKVRVSSRKLFVQRGWLTGSYALRRSAGRIFRSPLVSDTQVWTANRDWRFSNEAPACRWMPAPLLPRGVPRARSPRYCPSPSTDRATGAAGAVEQKRSRRVPGAARVGAAGEGRCPHPTGHSSFTSASFVLDGAIIRPQP